MQKLRIFAASPSDMAAERAKIEDVALSLKPLADSLGIVLEVVDWGSVVPDMGRPEQVILEQMGPTSWDIFIGLLWHRFGSATGETDKRTSKEYLSGTEEEFRTAYRLWQNYKRPRIMMYRCNRNIHPEDLNPEQYQRVRDFFGQFDAIKGAHPGLYQTFNTARSFEKLLNDNLQKILIEYGAKLAGEKDRATASADRKTARQKIFICYKRLAKDDRALAEYLRDRLTEMGHSVFIDTSMRMGEAWLEEVDERIRSSDYLIVLISRESADSEMVRAEMRRAYEYRSRAGNPKPLPVLLNYQDLLPYAIEAFLGSYQHITWKNDQDNEHILGEIIRVIGGEARPLKATSTEKSSSLYFSEDGRAMGSAEEKTRPLPEFDPRFLYDLDEPGGSVKLGDYFYIEREADERLKRAIVKRGETITIRASRQTGKSSLLARGVHHAASTASIVYVDLQSIEHAEFESANRFLKYFAGFITRKLRMDAGAVENVWQEALGPQDKLVKVMEDHILPNSDRQIVLAIDEADRLLTVPFQNDFFALMRSWHNNRAIDPLWTRLNLAMVIATEPYLLISNPNQSPFNVGVKINLEDFNREQVWDLNHRHGDPIQERAREDFFKLFSGHPYLTRKALYLLVSEDWSWGNLNDQAADDQGPFADHLRHQLWFIQEDPTLREALRQVLLDKRCGDSKVLWRLLRAGLVKGIGDLYYCRCGLYERYFKEHLT